MRDLDDNGIAEVIAASGGGVRPQVRVLDSFTGDVVRDFPALTPNYTDGLYVG
jgi:hypothetical protein